ncbi:hypothetical protein ACTRXD_00725 [Nitrospira sp. T9]|uniref:hypothetical protein n=1 Tax=unclassified Nitrospira TaxID=2652172 RepID=UPI003F990468
MFVEEWTTGQYNLKKTHILLLSHHSHLIFFKETKNPLAPTNIPTQQFGNPPTPVFKEGLLKKATSGVLAIFPCSRTQRTLRA